ncbi:unnamed protein product [Adineta steineri]|uniref:Choline transporter-like protein n=1 Tax=Adineta steineri TaxID=433720 RepID=A0A815Q2L1_9BILA|nr:unnamed protein product [Adineta steineri]
MMNEAFSDGNAVGNVPHPALDQAVSKNHDFSSGYDNRRVGFKRTWKERGFRIYCWAFKLSIISICWLLTIVYVALSTRLFTGDDHLFENIPGLLESFKKVWLYASIFTITCSSITSFLTSLLIQMCADRVSTCTLIVFIIIEFNLIIFILWLWGVAIFTNIIRFITACFIDQWSSSNNADQRSIIEIYTERALTTDFKTICIGPQSQSAFRIESRMRESRKWVKVLINILMHCPQIFKMLVGLMNEWEFEYEVLIRQPFAQASGSITELLKKRDSDMLTNDTIIGQFLWVNNLLGAVISTVISIVINSCIAYTLAENSLREDIAAASLIAIGIAPFISLLFSSVMSTMFKSYVRMIFICFTLNPEALKTTHPDHYASLASAWNTLHPKESATSGDSNNI